MKTELGCAGHFIAAQSCRWRRHTQLDHFRVSSVGDYQHPCGMNGETKRATIGAGADAFYETMVFPISDEEAYPEESCGCRFVTDWGGLECRRYATAGEAQRGHEEMVAKYEALTPAPDHGGRKEETA